MVPFPKLESPPTTGDADDGLLWFDDNRLFIPYKWLFKDLEDLLVDNRGLNTEIRHWCSVIKRGVTGY